RVRDLAHLEREDVSLGGTIIVLSVADIWLRPNAPVDKMHQTADVFKPRSVLHHPRDILQVHEGGLLMVFDQQQALKVELAQLTQVGQLGQVVGELEDRSRTSPPRSSDRSRQMLSSHKQRRRELNRSKSQPKVRGCGTRASCMDPYPCS
ncbi:hypothetical protein CPC16_005077, partial [Podila verticillata]